MSAETGTLTIDGTVIDAVTEISDSGGMNTPSKRTEQGFEWSSYVNAKPVRIEVDAYVELGNLKSIVGLRNKTEPVSASLGAIALEQATVDEVEVTQSYDEKNYHRVLITIEEVKTPSSDTVQVIQTGNGSAGGSTGGGGGSDGGSRVGFVPSNPVAATGSGGVGGATGGGAGGGDSSSSDTASKETGNAVGNALGDAGDAIGSAASAIGNAIGL